MRWLFLSIALVACTGAADAPDGAIDPGGKGDGPSSAAVPPGRTRAHELWAGCDAGTQLPAHLW